MRILSGLLSVKYSGRGEAFLPPYERIVMLKEDGSISVHSGKGYKPLNYMMGPTVFHENFDTDYVKEWVFKAKNETLTIFFEKIDNDITIPLPLDEPGLMREKTEAQLQQWLVKNLHTIDDELVFVANEFQTGAGPVDILAKNINNENIVAIEIKRVATMNAIDQVLRYVHALQEKEPNKTITGAIAASEFKPTAISQAKLYNIKCYDIPLHWFKDEKDKETKTTLDLFNF